jgi:hypothetical protein
MTTPDTHTNPQSRRRHFGRGGWPAEGEEQFYPSVMMKITLEKTRTANRTYSNRTIAFTCVGFGEDESSSKELPFNTFNE